MTDRIFRQHGGVSVSPRSPLYRQLITEWAGLNALPSTRDAIIRWAHRHETLRGFTRPGDIVDAIDAASPADKDAVLTALIALFHDRHQLAGRVILQAMLPKLSRLASGSRPNAADAATIEDRRHAVIAEFWDVLAHYPLARRPTTVAGNLALDTLHRLGGAQPPSVEIALAPAVVDALSHRTSATERCTRSSGEMRGPLGGLSTDGDLTEVTSWALARHVITAAEADLIVTIYTPHSGAHGSYGFTAVATELGITTAAVRQRCSRAVRRLTTAVRSEMIEPAVA